VGDSLEMVRKAIDHVLNRVITVQFSGLNLHIGGIKFGDFLVWDAKFKAELDIVMVIFERTYSRRDS
jgi:hypothetical protein